MIQDNRTTADTNEGKHAEREGYRIVVYKHMAFAFQTPLQQCRSGACALLLPPLVECLLAIILIVRASFSNHAPCPRTHDSLNHQLTSHKCRQSLRPHFPWEVTSTIRAQPLIHHSFSSFCIFDLSQYMVRIIGVWGRRNATTVCEDITTGLP